MANLQIINPHEIARTHRHTPSALRIIVEGQEAYTAVDGEKTYMEPGDFVTTPSWSWHDHGNEGVAPMIWLDGLDVPLVHHLEAGFFEYHPQQTQSLTQPSDLSARLYSAGGLMPTWVRHKGLHSPIVNYEWAHCYEVLDQLAKESEGSPYDGICVEYTNPTTGGPTMATIACFAQFL